ncbi:uncharacterized protein LOC106464561 [Limulus polyphemus]|uniref:Uncharacterized protein LOC106464561 n=1 Tax=Limulus polyphemus TaxID=6850 RepID=A0ABM1SY07_LIMPO|nr:uncharacterized protein LOC106464561 [Limulus polyphemus]
MQLVRATRLSLLVTCLIGVEQIIADKTDPEFPNIERITYGSYQSTVEVSINPENSSVYVTEYYEEVTERGRLDLMIDGKHTTLVYDKETMQMMGVMDNTCTVINITSALLNYESFFWGWLDHRPGHLLIGPSAILRKALDNKPEYVASTYIRGIKCNMWSHQDPANKEVTIEYYFTEPTWTNANGLNKVIPVRVSVYGNAITSTSDGKKIEFDQVFDFVAYSPYVRHFNVFQPPVGIGCLTRTNVKPVPKIGSKIFYLGEEYSLKEKEDHIKSFIHLYKIYFDSLFKLVRFDSWEEKGLKTEIQDFNTGIAYNIDNEKRCSRGPIRGSPAEKLGWGFVGSLKTTEEFLSLTGAYYHIGYETIRGIRCNVWESVITNVTMGDKFYVRVVYTYYFMTQWWEAIVDGVTEEQRPVRFMITGYEKTGEPPTLRKQFNMFGFRDTGIDMDIFKMFSLEDCEFLDGMEYFQVVFNVNRTQAVIAEMNDHLFRTYTLILLASEMKVSPIRLPSIRVSKTYLQFIEIERDGFWVAVKADGRLPTRKILQYRRMRSQVSKEYGRELQGSPCTPPGLAYVQSVSQKDCQERNSKMEKMKLN